MLRRHQNNSRMTLAHLHQVYRTRGTASWLETAHVTPVYKAGSQHSANNYRPMSLTIILCKFLGYIMLGDILGFLQNNQHRFRRGLSCETQLCATAHDILTATDKGQRVHLIGFIMHFLWESVLKLWPQMNIWLVGLFCHKHYMLRDWVFILLRKYKKKQTKWVE